MKHLIVGLGNIGSEYNFTRHNVGFMVLDQLAKIQKTTFHKARLADLATFQHRDKTLFLTKPTTYMNQSGRAVAYWLHKLKLPVKQSLIIVDDIAIPFGKLRMRAQGTAAGHNGLKSIETSLNTHAYPRLRIGIGNAFPRGKQANYVLAPFTPKEQETLPTVIDQACQIVDTFGIVGIGRTMEQYNRNARK